MNEAKLFGQTTKVDPALSTLIVAYAQGASVPSLAFPAVQAIDGLESSVGAIRGSVFIGELGSVKLGLDGRWTAQERREIGVRFEDGSRLRAEHAVSIHQANNFKPATGATSKTEFELADWQWQGAASALAWVGVLHGVDFRQGNLVATSPGRTSCTSLRLKGNCTWFLLAQGYAGKRTCVALIVADDGEQMRSNLWADFSALEFLFGGPIRLDQLVGIGAQNDPVAAIGLSLGYRFRASATHEPPLPEHAREGDQVHSTWMAAAFPLLARALAADEPNPVTVATAGYVDSTIGHIDGQYLFAQIALEATANRLVPDRPPLVHDVHVWNDWVKSNRDNLKAHAVDDRALNTLYMKLKHASSATTSSLVRRALAALGVAAPDEALDEIEGRNIVAHTLSMNEDEVYDLERDLRRIRIIRALLAALLLRRIGYEGALSGWDLDGMRHPVRADWFPVSEAAARAAQEIFEAETAPSAP